VVLDVRCISNPGGPCADSNRAAPGASLRLSGRNLGAAALVVFYGDKGARDDVTSPATPQTARRALTSVPQGAHSGPVALIDLAGRRARRWAGLLVEGMQPLLGTYRPAGMPQPVEAAVSQPRTLFYGAPQRAVFTYRVPSAMDLQVNLVRLTDNAVVRSWDQPSVTPGALNRVRWTGAVKGRVPQVGKYAFVLSPRGAAAAGVRATADQPADAITVYDYMFPIRGAHEFGLGAGRFGAGRAGHSHQGQDVFAECGTPLVAARGGTVKFSGFHSAAGYYVVIDGKGTGADNAYMHLRQRADVLVGDHVYTGQEIGQVGDTGDAVGCHLHFEEWTSPGWYDGGHPVDPLPDLKRWDRTS
jgi:murein DD-endopeptidase MepM/ murein hydrolase activator NlpD